MLFTIMINHAENVISLVTHLSTTSHVISTVNMDQVNQLGNLVWSIKGQMHQHLIDNGVSFYFKGS